MRGSGMDASEIDVKRLSLGPNDVLVAKYNGQIDEKTARRIRDQLEATLPINGSKIIVIDDNVDLLVLEA
jgi:hypothetical protein